MTSDPTAILLQHEYRFGSDTNCACGTPGIFDWDDWVRHVAAVLNEGKT